MSRSRLMAVLSAAVLVTGCQSNDLGHPPHLRYGEEACDSCRMIISDDRYAAALVTRDGDVLRFDDIGCLVQHEANRLRPDVAYWVRDCTGGGWLNAREAHFIHSPSIASPMGFGLAARPTGQPAGAVLDARSLRFHELPGFLATSVPGTEDHHPHEGHGLPEQPHS